MEELLGTVSNAAGVWNIIQAGNAVISFVNGCATLGALIAVGWQHLRNAKDKTVTFGTRLKQLRLSRNMTMQQLGSLIQVQNSTISQWERGLTGPPPAQRISRICDALGCPEKELELLTLASIARGRVVVSSAGLSESHLCAANAVEQAARQGRLTHRKAREILSLLES